MGKFDSVKSGALKFDSFLDNFSLDRHHTIERFARSVGVITLTGGMLFGATIYAWHKDGQVNLSATGVYSSEFTSSKTGNKGQVLGVYRNEANNRAVVMMKFTTPDNMSSEASDYYAHVVGIKGGPDGDGTKVGKAMSGSVISFGAGTGVIGVVLDAPDGFDEKILNVTMRAKKEYKTGEGAVDTGDPASQGESSKRFDQWRVMINPAADDVGVVSSLSGSGSPDPAKVYQETVGRADEIAQREQLDTTLVQMRGALDQMRSYEAELATTSVRVGDDPDVHLLAPRLPDVLVGDTIDGMSSAELAEEFKTKTGDEIPGIGDKSTAAREIDNVDPNYYVSTYVLHPGTVLPGGLDFDWRTKTLSEGYLDDLAGENGDPFEFMQGVLAAKQNLTSVTDLEWKLSNGQELTAGSGYVPGNVSSLAPLTTLRNNLSNAYSTYIKLKSDYEQTQLVKLLSTELKMRQMSETATVATGDEAVTFLR